MAHSEAAQKVALQKTKHDNKFLSRMNQNFEGGLEE
jgi:hypothetical protein